MRETDPELRSRIEGLKRSANEQPRADRRSRRETVLVADDEPMVRKCVAEALRESGYRVLEAEGGADALAIAEAYAGPIHLLLTDVMMPGIWGTELAACLQERRPETRILFMSADPAQVLPKCGPEVLALGKPFVFEELTRAVRAALDAGRSRPAAH